MPNPQKGPEGPRQGRLGASWPLPAGDPGDVGFYALGR